MSSTDYFSLYNSLSPQFMDSKFGYFKRDEEIKVEDDKGNILLSEKPFFQNPQQWNHVVSGRSDVINNKVIIKVTFLNIHDSL